MTKDEWNSLQPNDIVKCDGNDAVTIREERVDLPEGYGYPEKIRGHGYKAFWFTNSGWEYRGEQYKVIYRQSISLSNSLQGDRLSLIEE